jgi:HK97 gp10 family phage protein
MATTFNHFPKIGEQMHDALSLVVRKTAMDIQANIQGFIRANGQIDTGFMINSAYTVTSQGSSYSGGGKALPEVGAPPDDMTAYAAIAAAYAFFQNYGTSHMPARPFFEPGIEKTRPGFQAAVSAVADKLGGA